MKLANIQPNKYLLSFCFVCLVAPAFCQKNEVEDEITTIFMKVVGKYSYEGETEYGEAEKVSGYQWATEIKDGNLILAASVEEDTRPLWGKDFTAHSSYDVVYYFPIKYYDRITRFENGFTIISNRNSSCKRVKKNIEFKDALGDGKSFTAKDETKYFGRFDFSFLELSDEDISSVDELLKQLREANGKFAPSNDLISNANDLIFEARDLYNNKQYSLAILKCDKVLRDVAQHGEAFEIRALSRYKLDDKSSESSKLIVEDCTNAFKFGFLGMHDGRSQLYLTRAFAKENLNLSPNQDYKDALLMGDEVVTKYCEDSHDKTKNSWCDIKPLSFSINFSGLPLENQKVSFSKTVTNYKLMQSSKMKEVVLIIGYESSEKSFWYSAITKEKSLINHKMRKFNAKEFLGRYLILGFHFDGSLFSQNIYVDLEEEQFLSEANWNSVKLTKKLAKYYNYGIVWIDVPTN